MDVVFRRKTMLTASCLLSLELRTVAAEKTGWHFLRESDDRYFLFQPEEFTVRHLAAIFLIEQDLVVDIIVVVVGY